MASTMQPGLHEDQALENEFDRPERAQIRAQLAIAAAIDRLAEAVENSD